jgi:transposase-like protein
MGSILKCSLCGQQTRILAGTIFQDTKLSIQLWFRAIWCVVTPKNGASAKELSRILGISYQTTWALLQKLRRVIVSSTRSKLNGTIEIYDCYIGGKEEGIIGRGSEKKSLVIVAVEIQPPKIGRIRMSLIENATSSSLFSFINDSIKTGSTINTDGWSGYSGLKSIGFEHIITSVSNNLDVLPHVHLVISLLKRWLLGTHQGAVSKRYLDYYLDEFTFRFNRRTSKSRGLLFQRLLENAIITPPITIDSIIGVANSMPTINKQF